MGQVSYSVVVATRNRTDALSLSLPLLIRQSRRPDAIYLIDSSDNPLPNKDLIAKLSTQTDIPIHYETSEAGASLQRNKGLCRVQSDVVFCPDDDSLIFPGCMDQMMQVYDLDLDGKVGGVCSAEAMSAPEGVLDDATSAPYEMRKADKLKLAIGKVRGQAEDRYCRDPFHTVADRLYKRLGLNSIGDSVDLNGDDLIYVPWMTGFRMSFRTDVIRKIQFNENLGRYALCEDVDACFGVLKTHSLVGARKAQIYHHKSPEKRANGRALGAMHILNRAYVIARTGQADKKVEAQFRRFALYKTALYLASSNSQFGRERLAGAWSAFRLSAPIFKAAASELDSVYLMQRAKCIRSDG